MRSEIAILNALSRYSRFQAHVFQYLLDVLSSMTGVYSFMFLKDLFIYLFEGKKVRGGKMNIFYFY